MPAELFEEYRDRIRRYIAGMVRDSAAAEDLTQETFLRAFRGAEGLRDPKAARGWLYRIATRVCLDHLREHVPHVPVEGIDAPAKEPSAQELSERGETSACVQRCLDYLSDSYRSVLLLHDAHGLTSAEIAELLGVEVGAVKIRLHRARRKLQQLAEIGCVVSEDSSGTPSCSPKCGV